MKKILFPLFLLTAFFFLAYSDSADAACNGTCQAAACTNGVADGECSGELNCCKPSSSGNGIETPKGTGLPEGTITGALSNALGILEEIFLLLSMIAFAIVGIMFLFSLGNANSSAHTNAKAYFGQAVTALLLVGGSYIIITTINTLLGG